MKLPNKKGAVVDTVFCPSLIFVLDLENSKNIKGLPKHLDWHGATRSGIEALEMPFQVKLTNMPVVNPELTESQSWSKSSQNNIFHVSISNPSYSMIFINFDQNWPSLTRGWLLGAPKT